LDVKAIEGSNLFSMKSKKSQTIIQTIIVLILVIIGGVIIFNFANLSIQGYVIKDSFSASEEGIKYNSEFESPNDSDYTIITLAKATFYIFLGIATVILAISFLIKNIKK
jgi:hypothetical protein